MVDPEIHTPAFAVDTCLTVLPETAATSATTDENLIPPEAIVPSRILPVTATPGQSPTTKIPALLMTAPAPLTTFPNTAALAAYSTTILLMSPEPTIPTVVKKLRTM